MRFPRLLCAALAALALLLAGAPPARAVTPLYPSRLPSQAGGTGPFYGAGAPVNGTDEVQTVTVNGSPAGGTFQLAYGTFSTSQLAYNATASAVQTALRALSPIGSGGVSVSGSAGGPYTVTFSGALGRLNVPALTQFSNSLTGGTNPSVSVITATPGVDATGRGCAPGALYLDTAAGAVYVNDGTANAPAWKAIGTTRTAGVSTAAAGSTTSDAGVLPAATGTVYPTSAADDTKGVRVNAADKVTGRMLFIGNGVANKILKVYGPSGAVINGGSADAAFSSVSGKGVVLYCLDATGNTWLAW